MSIKQILIATTNDGVAVAESGSDASWSVRQSLRGNDVRCIAADPHSPGVVYAGTQGNGLFRSDDFGQTWRSAGLAGKYVKAVSVSPLEPDTVYVGTRPAWLLCSRDGGDTWTELTSFRRIPSRKFWFSPAEAPFRAYVQGIALSPADPGLIVAGIEFGAVVRSSDGGETWTDHRPGALRDCHSICFHPRDASYVYEAGGSGGGAAVSRDAGSTFERARDGLADNYGWACAADPDDPEVWFVSVAPGPRRAHGSGDARASIYRRRGRSRWERLSGGLPDPLEHMPYALLTDPRAPGHLYAGLSNGEIWHSDDLGDQWKRLPVKLPSIARSLVLCATSQ